MAVKDRRVYDLTGRRTVKKVGARGPDRSIFENIDRNYLESMDRVSRRNMEICASFLARMIEKYGQEVLAEIEEEEKNSAIKAEERASVEA